MKSMEEDCRERTERRKKNKEEAEEIKERADKEFNKGNYQKLVELYNEVSFFLYFLPFLHNSYIF